MEELRKVFYHTMAELMHENQQVIYLDADLAGAMGTAGLFQGSHSSRPLTWELWKPI
ncbi:MAG: hypothetical protein V8Q57_00985 [Blautia sp.]